MSELPEPPVPLTLDLRDFRWMKLDLVALFSSDFNSTTNDLAWRIGVTLWGKAWHQVPAGSLPDSDAMMCNLAGLGRDLKTWETVKSEALHGFYKCSDGRIYHAFLCKMALDAQQERERFERRKEADRARKSSGASAGNSTGKALGIPQEKQNNSVGIPAENAVEGQGQGQGQGDKDKLASTFPDSVSRGVRPIATQILARYSHIRELTWPGSWPPMNSTENIYIASQWEKSGITPNIAEDIFDQVCTRYAKTHDEPPASLNYFQKSMAEAAAQNAPPTAEENAKARTAMIMFAGVWKNDRDRYPDAIGKPGTGDCKLHPDLQAWLLGTGPQPADIPP